MPPKRLFEEVLLIYRTEPSLHDLFCEGESDWSIFQSFLNAASGGTASVYHANQIEWPAEFDAVGGNRERIRKLSEILTSEGLQGTCVIDKDLDSIQDETPQNRNLLKTDYACTHSYGLDNNDMIAFISINYRLDISPAQMALIYEACKHLFVVRYLRDKYCPGNRLAPSPSIFSNQKKLVISTEGYINACKRLNGYNDRWDLIIEEEETIFSSLDEDYRAYINFHDFDAVLSAVVRTLKRNAPRLPSGLATAHCGYVMVAQGRFWFPLFSAISTRML